MRCRGVEGRLTALLREELDTAEALAVNAHLETCAACREHLARASRLHAHLGALAAPALGAARHEALRERTLAALRHAPPPVGAARAWQLGAVVGVAAMAAGLVLWLWPRAPGLGPAPRPAMPTAVRPAAPAPAAPAAVAARPRCGDGGWAVGCALQAGSDGQRADLEGVAELWLEPDTLVGLEGGAPETRLRLERGRVLLRVRPLSAGSSFAVAAGEVVATVRGTLFAVERGDHHVRVDLTRGAVTVHLPGAARGLEAGQRGVVTAGGLEVEPLAAAQAAADLARLPEVGTAPASQRSAPVAATAPEPFYRRAEAARRAGRSAEAARAYQEIVGRFPGTAAAANASLALGDLYLGPLGRPEAALRAYDRLVAAHAAGAVREEALAGRARALRALARSAPARAAAAAYVRQYPGGIHEREMRALAR